MSKSGHLLYQIGRHNLDHVTWACKVHWSWETFRM